MNVQIASCTIATVAFESMLAHASAEAPREACGLLRGRADEIRAAIATGNVAAHPERSFEIDPAALLRHHREARGHGDTVIGHYHSHPNGNVEPSKTDAARAVADGQLWLIVGDGCIAAWRSVAAGSLHGRFIPVALVVR
ncbi:MAG: Mov34/MPN/PAD-1 family protein [Polymorphobacter sp.]